MNLKVLADDYVILLVQHNIEQPSQEMVVDRLYDAQHEVYIMLEQSDAHNWAVDYMIDISATHGRYLICIIR